MHELTMTMVVMLMKMMTMTIIFSTKQMFLSLL